MATSRRKTESSLIMGLSICLPSCTAMLLLLWHLRTILSSCLCRSTSRSPSNTHCTSERREGRERKTARDRGQSLYIKKESQWTAVISKSQHCTFIANFNVHLLKRNITRKLNCCLKWFFLFLEIENDI